MGDGTILENVWLSEIEVESDRYPAFVDTRNFLIKNYDFLRSERDVYMRMYGNGSALEEYNKPEDIIEALDLVRDDSFISFLYDLQLGLGGVVDVDFVNTVINYMQDSGIEIIAGSDTGKIMAEARKITGLSYKGKEDEIDGFSAFYTYNIDDDGTIRDVIFVNPEKLKIPSMVLLALAHEWGHREEVHRSSGAEKLRKSDTNCTHTEFVSSLYGIHAAMVIDSMGSDANIIQVGVVSNLIIFDVVMSDEE